LVVCHVLCTIASAHGRLYLTSPHLTSHHITSHHITSHHVSVDGCCTKNQYQYQHQYSVMLAQATGSSPLQCGDTYSSPPSPFGESELCTESTMIFRHSITLSRPVLSYPILSCPLKMWGSSSSPRVGWWYVCMYVHTMPPHIYLHTCTSSTYSVHRTAIAIA